jgi:hypothetical protein
MVFDPRFSAFIRVQPFWPGKEKVGNDMETTPDKRRAAHVIGRLLLHWFWVNLLLSYPGLRLPNHNRALQNNENQDKGQADQGKES